MTQRWLSFPRPIRYAKTMRLSLVAAALIVSVPAFAAETAWQELAPDTRVRLIASEAVDSEGRSHVALELDMPAGTKTYWKVPGETGIPLSLDFSGSEGVAAGAAIWPFPQIETAAAYTDFVHYGHVVIPIEITAAGKAGSVELDTLMGICSDICVPAQASFSLPLDFSRPDSGHVLRIEQALSASPLDWPDRDPPVGEARFDPKAGTLAVRVDTARLDPATLITDASAAGYVFGAPQKSPETDVVLFALLGGSEPVALEGRAVTFVFMTPDGPYQVTREIVVSTGD